MKHGEVWWAATPGGDRPVLVLTRDPVADRIGSIVVAAITRTVRGLVSELPLSPSDGVPTECVANFDNLHTIPATPSDDGSPPSHPTVCPSCAEPCKQRQAADPHVAPTELNRMRDFARLQELTSRDESSTT